MARACNARCNSDSTNLYPRHHRRSERDARRCCTARVALAALDAASAPWREALEYLDEDVLAEATAESRAFGAGPAAAVDKLGRGLLAQLAAWQQSTGELGRALTTATEGRPLPGWSTHAGRTEDIGWRQTRTTLLEAVAHHHHAHPLAAIVELGGELELPATRNGHFKGRAVLEGCAVSDAGRRRCGGRRPVR
ncbi:hypothetical protein [Streptomyces sp. NPDC007355]|uniref:hypothetical protein n=1 Tax=Streptomyces sp. NPDC007355 TaxID=3364778 RepID=UPI00368DA62E